MKVVSLFLCVPFRERDFKFKNSKDNEGQEGERLYF